MMEKSAASYHSASGSIRLEPADLIAVDFATAVSAGLDRSTLDEIRKHGRELRRNILLLPADAVTQEMEDALDGAGALHPVFRDPTNALVIALPEVRVEGTSPGGMELLREEFRRDAGIEIVSDGADRLVLRPVSGRGLDALELANRLYKIAKPAMSQPRFLRVIDRPNSSS